MYKLQFFVPEAHLESVKAAVVKAGAGNVGTYKKCAWNVLGSGQYEPTDESDPYQGHSGKLENVREFMVDVVVEDKLIKTVIETLLEAHPYETPAYGAWKLLTLDDF
ncbi:MAG: NGG1p interacting factor NIF3 [Coxiellaceae bacterium]|nr:NGG1p interacting factor NIF3 [Coxiellaceae bacterium]